VPQALLPIVPDGATPVNDCVSILRENEQWTYFYGLHPVFAHEERDRRSFRMFTAQLIERGMCRQVDIVRTFGVSSNSVKRSVKKYREEGIKAFYHPRQGRGATVMKEKIILRAQELLTRGYSLKEVAGELDIKYDTLRKAVGQGRVQEPSAAEKANLDCADSDSSAASDKSERSKADAAAEMGMACTRAGERVLAAFGMLKGAPTRFETCRDVSFGGVLCALPSLTQNGLFEHLVQCFPSLTGYYTTVQVVLLLAYMALCRIKTVERLQYESPGELGKLLGLDRVPEVRCLRQKLAALSKGNAPERWAGLLSHDWLEAAPDLAGTLYVDGHVRLYHGHQTELPRRYVSRQRLCLRGTTDYWVNDALGQPFFVIERPVDHGLLEALRSDIVPRLLQDVPHQPTQEELNCDPYRFRFVIVFDREGYSPSFFREMWRKHRIACITYHKFPKEAWPKEWFADSQVTLPNGEEVSMMLAEMGSWIGDAKNGLWAREVRKLTESGHQTSLISTVYSQISLQDAATMFSRWAQENFFRYMMEHFAIDLLSEYQTEEIPGTNRPVVNPSWRKLDSRSRSLKGKLTQRQARFAALTLHPEADASRVPQWQQRKAKLLEEIQQLEHELDQVKQLMKETPQHLKWNELPQADKFERLAPSRKRLTDTVKMIAYRSETAMAGIVREKLARTDDARALLRDLFRSEADLLPDLNEGLLRVNVHPMANDRSNHAIQHLLNYLNTAAFTYPGTNLQLVYSLVGAADIKIGAS
jgi:transposase